MYKMTKKNFFKYAVIVATVAMTAFAMSGCELFKDDDAGIENVAISGHKVTAKVEDGAKYNENHEVQFGYFYNGGEAIYATSKFANGGFTVELPAEVDKKYLFPANAHESAAYSVSNKDANISGRMQFRLMKSDGQGGVGTLIPLKTKCNTHTEVRYIYADRDVNLSGTFSNETHELRLKKGWNVTYYTRTLRSFNDYDILLETDAISGVKWTLEPNTYYNDRVPPLINESENTEEPTNDHDGNSNFEKEVFDLTNAERVKQGLKPFVWNDRLADVARAHSTDMANRNFFAHENPDGLSPFDRMRNAGISYRYAAENIGKGYNTPKDAVDGWMNSPGHRANILNENLTDLGVGFHEYHWTQKFIAL